MTTTVKKKILVTERDRTGEMFRQALEKEGYDVKIADSGESGLLVFSYFSPDLVTTSMRLNCDDQGRPLPGMDGFAYAMALRDQDGFRGPIVAVTSGRIEDYAALHGVPTEDIPKYITKTVPKPVYASTLIHEIRELLKA